MKESAIGISCTRRKFLATVSTLVLTSRGYPAKDSPTVPTVDERIRTLATQAPLAMRFQGTFLDQCRTWQGEFAGKLRSLLGPHQPPGTWKTAVRHITELEDHFREELVLTAEGYSPLPIYLLAPRKVTKPRPGILALHGHGEYGHHPVAGRDDMPGVATAIREANYDYGRELVRRGYVVAVPCLTPFGDRLGKLDTYQGQDPCAVSFVRLQILGKVLMGENLRDSLWGLDFLARDPRVDSDRLGCVGLSYGGRMTMLTAALQPRIRAAVISGALNVMQERIMVPYSCGAQVIPGLLQYGDTPEIASLIAPRPCLWEVGAKDELISARWAEEALTRIRGAYKAYDAEDGLSVDRFQGGHAWNGRVAYPWLERILG